MKAFPSIDWDSQIESKNNQLTPISSGMELRDYFAAKAMQALLSSPNCDKEVNASLICAYSYTFADEMMKAREQ